MTKEAFVVSVIIPVYNVSAYIERCIRSVMSQTYGNIECVIVDDATQDDSIIQCERLISNYHGTIQFMILHHQMNRGLSAARNTGIDAATGEYIFFLDGDDEITCDCIEKLVSPVMRDETIELVRGERIRQYEGFPTPKRHQRIIQGQEEDVISIEAVRDKHFNGKFGTAAWNRLIKKDFLDQHQLRFKEGIIYEDTLWTFFLVKYLSHLYIIPDVTYYYYIRPHSIVTGTGKEEKSRSRCIVFEEIANHFTPGDSGREAQYYVRKFCRRCFACSDSPSFKRSALLFKKALSGQQYIFERMFLSLTVFMSKTALRRRLFSHVLDIGASVRRKAKSIRKLL
ncbi:MAG: glycosyltransferase family 2 protein [Prevotella sp.]|nr:glycosyltransferase family 2 protein [Prevotella sp.]